MSAGYVVDLYHGTLMAPSITGNQLSGQWPCSGAVIGNTVDLLHANTFTNLFVAAGMSTSGQLRLQVQTSDATTSGTFTDPTSGLAAFPTDFQSGGILWLNSGGANLISGFFQAAGFQRPSRYARVNALSGDFYAGGFSAGFIGQAKSTHASGFAGYSFSPSSGVISV